MMRHVFRLFLALLLLSTTVIPAAAQSDLGYFPVEGLGVLDQEDLEVDVNLHGSTLLIAAGALEAQDPRLKELVSSLTRVRVQVGNAERLDPQIVADRIAGAVAQLEAQGWVRIASVDSDGEKIYIYSIDGSDGNVAGLTALVSEGTEEVVVANLAGSIDPVLLGTMISHLGELDFDPFRASDSSND